MTTTEPPSPVDIIDLMPMQGVHPWVEEQARGHRYSPDYAGLATLEPNKLLIVTLA